MHRLTRSLCALWLVSALATVIGCAPTLEPSLTIPATNAMAMAFDGSGDRLWVAASDRVDAYRTQDGMLVASFDTPYMSMDIAYSSGADFVAIAGENGVIEVRDAKTLSQIWRLDDGPGVFPKICVSPKGDLLVAWWSTRTWGGDVPRWHVHPAQIRSLPDGSMLTEIGGLDEPITALAFGDAGKFVLVGASGTRDGRFVGRVFKWDIASDAEEVEYWGGRGSLVGVTADQTEIIACDPDGHLVWWDRVSGLVVHRMDIGTTCWDMDASSVGGVVAIGQGAAQAMIPVMVPQPTVATRTRTTIIDTQTRTVIGVVKHYSAVRAVAVSPDGSLVASVGFGQPIFITRVPTP